jgi:hypothetical protein
VARNYVLRSRQSGAVGGERGIAVPVRLVDERPGTAADARDSGHRPAPALALLSMGHKPSLSTPSKLSIWPEGARMDVPGIPDLNPNRHDRNFTPGGKSDSKRGKVSGFSYKSRTRLQRDLATMRVDAEAFTMALTLPGCGLEFFDHEFVRGAFDKLMRRLSATRAFSRVSGYWKRELQKRGAVHYHLLLYGLADELLRADFQAWAVAQWASFFAPHLSETDTEHHRWWHARAENMQEVRDFHTYFSKYITKDEDAEGVLPGRWWGSFNKNALPRSRREETAVPLKASVVIHRMARQRRQNRADEGKHRAIMKIMERDGAGCLALSRWELHRLRSGYDLNGFRNPPHARLCLEFYKVMCAKSKVRPGKVRFKGPQNAKITLCGKSAPVFAEQSLEFVNRKFGLSLKPETVSDLKDFVPDPLKPVPLGRTPRNMERVRLQSDFLGDLRIADRRPAYPIQMDYEPVRAKR